MLNPISPSPPPIPDSSGGTGTSTPTGFAGAEEDDVVDAGDEVGGAGRGGGGAGEQADGAPAALPEPGRLPHPLRAEPLPVQVDEGEPLALKVAAQEEEGVGVLYEDHALLAGSPREEKTFRTIHRH